MQLGDTAVLNTQLSSKRSSSHDKQQQLVADLIGRTGFPKQTSVLFPSTHWQGFLDLAVDTLELVMPNSHAMRSVEMYHA